MIMIQIDNKIFIKDQLFIPAVFSLKPVQVIDDQVGSRPE